MNTLNPKKNFTFSPNCLNTACTVKKTSAETSKRLLLILSVLAASIAVLTHPSLPQKAVRESLGFCFHALLPPLFPFMIAGELLIRAGFPDLCEKYIGRAFQKIFKINGRGAAAFVIGAFCGFPVGGRAAVSLYKSGCVDKKDAEKLTGICNNCGIGFLISGIGAGLWNSVSFGIILYLSQLFSAILSGILLFGLTKKVTLKNGSTDAKHSADPSASSAPQTVFSVSEALSSAVASSVASILKVMGFVVFFEVILSLLGTALDFYGLPPTVSALVYAFTEITAGAKAVFSLSKINGMYSLARILTFTVSSFGGLSVYMQLCAIALTEGVSMGTYIKTKLFQSLICTLIGTALVLSGTV